MSGFVGFVHADGAPEDLPLLRRLTDAMSYCGPDHRDVWVAGHVGLGHALLSPAPEPSKTEWQPCSLDGRTWIAADARIDGRAELAAALSADQRRRVSPDAPDAHLVLHAYAVWGERCVEHLIGDFAFAIWDGDRRRLVCARDHFGVVPLYYAGLPAGIAFGNVLRALRLHPSVSAALDERAIGDFLLFGLNMDPAATTFADIRMLPPAHVLTYEAGVARVRRYWEPPDDERELRLERPEAYVERFRAVFDQAVGDRLRSDRAGTHLTGGMDSTSVAATAQLVLSARGGGDLRAYAVVFDELIAEEEGRYAELVAARIGIPVEQVIADEYLMRPPDGALDWVGPEPGVIANQSPEYEINRRVSSFSRALLAGLGGDPLFRPPASWPSKPGPWRERASIASRALRAGRLPRYGMRSALRGAVRGGPPHPSPLPDWIDPEFARRMDLSTRLRDCWSYWAGVSTRREMTHPLWAAVFASSHPGAHGLPSRVLFPFFDLRLVQYVWETPYSWRPDKRLLRAAMHDRLPQAVLERPKTLLYAPTGRVHDDNPWHRLAVMPQTRRWRTALFTDAPVGEYLDVERAISLIDSPIPRRGPPAFENAFRLAHWLQSNARTIDTHTTKEPIDAASPVT